MVASRRRSSTKLFMAVCSGREAASREVASAMRPSTKSVTSSAAAAGDGDVVVAVLPAFAKRTCRAGEEECGEDEGEEAPWANGAAAEREAKAAALASRVCLTASACLAGRQKETSSPLRMAERSWVLDTTWCKGERGRGGRTACERTQRWAQMVLASSTCTGMRGSGIRAGKTEVYGI